MNSASPLENEILQMQVPSSLLFTVRTLQSHGFHTVVIGGAVRDFLLGIPVRDYDLASSATPEDVQKLFRRCIPTGIQHGTVTVMIGRAAYEITTFRKDGDYKDFRRPETIEFSEDLQEDLERRDFTINAIAFEITEPETAEKPSRSDPILTVSGILRDPLRGRADLKNRLIRAIGRAETRFQEDALRMLRACRFSAQLGFQIEASTFPAIKTLKKLILNVSRERILEEFKKLLGGKYAVKGLRYLRQAELWPLLFSAAPQTQRSLETLEKTQQMERAIARLADLQEFLSAHPDYPVSAAVPKFSLYWAVLFAPEPPAEPLEILPITETNLRHLTCSNREREAALHLLRSFSAAQIETHFKEPSSAQAGWRLRQWLSRVGREASDSALLLLRGFAPEPLWTAYAEEVRAQLLRDVPLQIKDLALDGHLLQKELPLPPGPEIGAVLRKLLEIVLQNPELNTKDELLRQAAHAAEEVLPQKSSPE